MAGALPKPLSGSRPTHRSFSLQARARFSFKLPRRKTSTPIPGKLTAEEKRAFDELAPAPPQESQKHLVPEEATSTPLKTSPLLASLLPLTFAQRRRDIRERREGFEMSGKPPTPFAIRAHTLLPLDVAFERDDIRRREEQSKSPIGASQQALSQSPHRVDAIASPGRSPSMSTPRSPASSRISASVSHPGPLSAAGSAPSIYSHSRSWAELSALSQPASAAEEESWNYDSLVAVYSGEHGCYSEGSARVGASADDSPGMRRMLENLSSSSFDEESFIRMAEDYVGW